MTEKKIKALDPKNSAPHDSDYLLENYFYQTRSDLLAERPCQQRDHSRLFHVQSHLSQKNHIYFQDLLTLLKPGTVLVLNETKVWPCRLHGHKSTGGTVEIFFLSLNSFEEKINTYLVYLKGSGKRKLGESFFMPGGGEGEVVQIIGDGSFLFEIKKNPLSSLSAYLDRFGEIPIPPYIRKGIADEQDKKDYQTVYSKNTGSLAAPTAGLHFSLDLMKALKDKGIIFSSVTLHVGLGTFSPVKSIDIRDHEMHSEEFFVEKIDWEKILLAQKENRPIVAVGTTSLRVLQSLVDQEGKFSDLFSPHFRQQQILHQTDVQLKKMSEFVSGKTKIFLYPGKKIYGVHGLITNFHLSGSTLLMLVSALIGRNEILKIYEEAIEKDYRFFSYGDAMYIEHFTWTTPP